MRLILLNTIALVVLFFVPAWAIIGDTPVTGWEFVGYGLDGIVAAFEDGELMNELADRAVFLWVGLGPLLAALAGLAAFSGSRRPPLTILAALLYGAGVAFVVFLAEGASGQLEVGGMAALGLSAVLLLVGIVVRRL